MKKIVLLLVAIASTSTSCEKDDICDAATATTPRLVIDFYDITNPTLKKNVSTLALIADGHESEPIIFTGVSHIAVPLKTTVDSTLYRFILNYKNTDTSIIDEDDLQFNYIRNNIYVSRACGFKTIFVLDSPNPYALTDGPALEGFWIKNVTLLQPNILNENETHINLSF